MKSIYIFFIAALTFCTGKEVSAQTPHLNTNSIILVDTGSGYTLTLLPGTLTGNQVLSLSNPMGTVVSKTAAYTALSSDRFIFVSNSVAIAYNITLPTAANKGQLITVTKTDANANNISVVAATGQTIVQIGTRATLTAQGYSVTLAADGGTIWYVVAHEAADAAAVVGAQQQNQGK